MEWNTRRHSPSLESAQLRGSDEGQALASSEEQGLLLSLRSGQSGQARPAGCISWLEPIDDSRLVCRSVENWTATSVWASLWWQQQCCSQATASTTGRPHTRHRPSTGTSWLVDEYYCGMMAMQCKASTSNDKNYYGTKATLHRPSTRNGQLMPKLFKLCRVHFQHENLSKSVKTYHEFWSWTTALA